MRDTASIVSIKHTKIEIMHCIWPEDPSDRVGK
jgi:hypothetical protein